MNTLSLFNPAIANDLFEALDRGISSFAAPAMTSSCGSLPRVDIRETKDAYILDMELPGLSENDVTVNLKDRSLTIASVKKTEKEQKDNFDDSTEWLLKERRDYEFTRRFSVPDDVNSANVEATFKNGILTITMAKEPETKPRVITINARS